MTATKPAVLIQPTEDNRLVQLAAAYDAAYAAAKAAEKRLKEITDGIKAELTLAAPGADDVRLDTADLDKPLRLSLSYRIGLDTAKLKENEPAIYEAYLKAPTAVWSLTSVKS